MHSTRLAELCFAFADGGLTERSRGRLWDTIEERTDTAMAPALTAIGDHVASWSGNWTTGPPGSSPVGGPAGPYRQRVGS